MKKKTIASISAILLMLALVVVMALTLGGEHNLKCDECSGAGIVDGAACEFCVDGVSDTPADSRYYGTAMALVPPVIAIVLALITKEVYSSLFIGIIAGSLFYSNFNPVGAVNAIVNDGLIANVGDSWNAGILIFLVLLGIMVALVNAAGGSAALAVGLRPTLRPAPVRCWLPLRWVC